MPLVLPGIYGPCYLDAPSAGDFGPARRIIRIPVPEPIPQQLPETEKEVKQDEPVAVPA